MLSLNTFLRHNFRGRLATSFLRSIPSSYISSRSITTQPTPASVKKLSESFIDGTSANYVEDMYIAWKKNPQSVHTSWNSYFKNVELGLPPGESYMSPPTLHHGSITQAPPQTTQQQQSTTNVSDLRKGVSDSMKLMLLVRAYQVRGHVLARLDPLEMSTPEVPPELRIERYGFTEADLNREILVGDNLISGFLSSNKHSITLGEVLKILQDTYCGTIGAEYMHIQERELCDWIRERFETATRYSFTPNEKRQILERLSFADQFERFLGTKFKATKRFGLDGCESFIPGMKALIDTAADMGVNNVVIGMPHRGRLNVLANIIRKPLATIFSEFGDGHIPSIDPNVMTMSGDVKYHLGTSYDRLTTNGKKVHLSLVANPSHLEAVDPVVEGKVRAKQHDQRDKTRGEVMPILIHGDASFAGQGVVYETFHLSDLPNYTTGGTVHIIVNNQIGFTTDPKSSRSSLYCTDVAKTINAPIFHVNGDDVEAVVHTMKLAAEWRQTFKKDIVVDIVCYRRFGHNEIDQPTFTQPLMYQKIEKQVPVIKKYSQQLQNEGVVSDDEYTKMKNSIQDIYEKAFAARNEKTNDVNDWLESRWEGLKVAGQAVTVRDTGVSEEVLRNIGKYLYTVPSGFAVHPFLARILKDKQTMFEGKPLDWATAEALAFGSLIHEGNDVRLSGQDVERGTFSHRHSVFHDQVNGKTYIPLQNVLKANKPPVEGFPAFQVTNSSLSEFAVLGFETGYSLENPHALILWEAQFGDFANGAQVIFDQFISSGEQKWNRQCGLVCLLPHGYDGAGPEHSSCRLERFLDLCDSNPYQPPPEGEAERQALQKANLSVVNVSTTANYFHVLRRQLHRDFRKPLIIPTPKWLLRYEPSFSPISDFTDKAETPRFKRLIPEAFPKDIVAPKSVKRLVFCTGQVYYSLLADRNAEKIKDVALVRIEQLYPFPFDLVTQQANLYPNAEVIWCQEEPLNMGAWSFVSSHFPTSIKGRPVRYTGRPPAGSPAVAGHAMHEYQLISLLGDALGYTPDFDKKMKSGH